MLGFVSSQTEFTVWMRENSQTLMKAARAIAWHEVNADDIFQEALADVYSKWGKLKDHPNLVAYCIAAMRNKHIDLRRKWERKRDDHESDLLSMTNMLLQTLDDSDRVAERLLIQSALASLTPSQRTVLFMHEVEGYALREIAEILEMPQGTAASHLNRGKLAVSSFIKLSNQIEAPIRKVIESQQVEVIDAEVIEE